MKVLIACEFSAVVRDAFRKRGHTAWSCDLLPCRNGNEFHIQDDVFRVIRRQGPYRQWRFDMLIFHYPCTYLCNSGVKHLYIDGRKENGICKERWACMEKAAREFKELLECDIPLKGGENPIPHKYAVDIIGRKYDQLIQPWQYGHGETKATCLWLEGLPKLKPTKIVPGREARIHKMGPSPDRGLLRSITYAGIADAFAEQWGSIILPQTTTQGEKK